MATYTLEQKTDVVLTALKRIGDKGCALLRATLFDAVREHPKWGINSLMLDEIIAALLEGGYIREIDPHIPKPSPLYCITVKGWLFKGYEKTKRDTGRENWPKRNWWFIPLMTLIATTTVNQGITFLTMQHQSNWIKDSLKSQRSKLQSLDSIVRRNTIHQSAHSVLTDTSQH